jgi:hypothetical protein
LVHQKFRTNIWGIKVEVVSSFSMLVVKEKGFIGEDFAMKPSDPGS